MSIGDGGFGGNNQSRGILYDRTFYSRVRIKNGDLSLGFAFSGGLLNITIDQKVDGFKYDTVQRISLSPTKARLFTYQIKKFREYITNNDVILPGTAFGVNAGMNDKVTYIGISANTDKTPIITIGKFDNTGQILEHQSIIFNTKYHFALDWTNIDSNEVEKCYYDGTELDMFEKVISNFANNMDGAVGYSAFDLGRYEISRILNKMDPIYDKLGIERMGNRDYGRGNSFLDQASSSTNKPSTPLSIDDIL